jgi:N-acetylmuramoyl-L-alanine amidase
MPAADEQPTSPAASESTLPRLRGLTWATTPRGGKLLLAVDPGITPTVRLFDGPHRLVIDLPGAILDPLISRPATDCDWVKQVRVGQFTDTCARVVVDLAQPIRWRQITSPNLGVELDAPPAAIGAAPGTFPLVRPTQPSPLPATIVRRPVKPWRECVIGLGAGHGGSDSGALGVGGLREASITLDVASRLRAMLEERGVRVVMTRDGETKLPKSFRKSFVKDPRLDVFLSLHCDAYRSSFRGTTAYYHGGCDVSREFAGFIRDAVVDGTGVFDRGVRRDTNVYETGFYVLREARVPAVLCEMAYVTNAGDAKLLRDPDFRQRMARALLVGLMRYLGAPSADLPG